MGGFGGPPRQAEECQRRDERAQREHAEDPHRSMRGLAGSVLERRLGLPVLDGSRTIVANLGVHLAGSKIVVDTSQVMPDIVRHLDPRAIAAQTDEGQEKLEDQDSSPHRGADYKDDGHRYLLADSLRNPKEFRPSMRCIE